MSSVDAHYLNEIAELNKTEAVIAAEDIYNMQGVKLLAKGEPITQKAANALILQKLIQPIDMSIRVPNAINGDRLVSRMDKLLCDGSQRLISTLLKRKDDINRLLATLHHGLHLNILLTNKLSVMEKRRPELLNHSLEVAATALTLGSLCQLSWGEQQQLVAIGLFHDFGVLHLAPEISNSDRKLSPKEWRHMHSHPAIAFTILKQFPMFHPHISIPVLEHHERLDGSGYPRKAQNNELSKLGKICAIAEIIIGVTNKNSMDHLEVVLKSLFGKVDITTINAMHRAVFSSTTSSNEVVGDLSESYAILSEIISSWEALRVEDYLEESKFLASLYPIMNDIHKMIHEAGSMTDPNVMPFIQSDPKASAEAYRLLRELLYQLDKALCFAHMIGDDTASIKSTNAIKEISAWLNLAPALMELIQTHSTLHTTCKASLC